MTPSAIKTSNDSIGRVECTGLVNLGSIPEGRSLLGDSAMLCDATRSRLL